MGKFRIGVNSEYKRNSVQPSVESESLNSQESASHSDLIQTIIKIEEKIVEVPVEVIKYIEKEIEVIKEVIVEKIVEVPVEVIKHVEKIIEVPVEKIIEIEKEVIKQIPIEIIKFVDRIELRFKTHPVMWSVLVVETLAIIGLLIK